MGFIMPPMVDHRKCFQFEGLPVIPGNLQADTWIIYSPFLKKSVEITGKDSFNNSLKDNLVSKHGDFFRQLDSKKSNSIVTELYITRNTNYSNIKKSIFHSINKFLAENSNTIKFNIVTCSVDIYSNEILKVLNLIETLSNEIVKPEIILTTSKVFSIEFFKLYWAKFSSLHLQVEDSKPQEMCEVIKNLKDIIHITVSFYVNKLNVYEVENFITCCIEHGIKDVNIEPVKAGEQAPLKEIFVLNLLKGIKKTLNSNITVNNCSLDNGKLLSPLDGEKTTNRTDNCCSCFANSLCYSDSDFQCYVTRNTIPSLIKCS